MGLLEIIMIGVGLSMDAAAVSMTNGMAYENLKPAHFLFIPFSYGLFQALMPCLGYFIGGIFAAFIVRYAGIAVLIILGVIGIKMMKEGVYGEQMNSCRKEPFTLTILFAQAVATSIDAFAVGIGFSALGVQIYAAALVIGVTTFLCSAMALLIGRKFGNILGCKAQILGGFILTAIAVKAVF